MNNKILGKALLASSVMPLSSGNQSFLKNIEPFLSLSTHRLLVLWRYFPDSVEVLGKILEDTEIVSIFDRGKRNTYTAVKKKRGKIGIDVTKLAFEDQLLIRNEYSQWGKSLVASLLSFLVAFIIAMYWRLLKKRDLDTLIAYEVTGAIIVRAISIWYPNCRKIGIFQGTALGSLYTNGSFSFWRAFIHYPIDVFALRQRYNKILITDDGTNGIKVASVIQKNNNDILSVPNSSEAYRYALGKKTNFLKKEEPKREKHVVVCSMRAVPWKRLDRIPHLLSALRDFDCETFDKIRFIIIGDGPILEDVKKLSISLRVENKIKFMREQPYKTALDIMSKANSVFLCSDMSNLSNSLLDALSLGIPVFALDAGSLRKFIEANDLFSSLVTVDPKLGKKECAKAFSKFIVSSKLSPKGFWMLDKGQRAMIVKEWLGTPLNRPGFSRHS